MIRFISSTPLEGMVLLATVARYRPWQRTDMDKHQKTLDGIGAAFLSILPGMGHLYLGVKRAHVFLVCGVALLVVAKFFWPMGWLFYIQLAIFSGVDAFSFGKRGRGLF